MELLSQADSESAFHQRLNDGLMSIIDIPDSAVGSGVTSFTDGGCKVQYRIMPPYVPTHIVVPTTVGE